MTRVVRGLAFAIAAMAGHGPAGAAPEPRPTPTASARKPAGAPDQFKSLQNQARAAKAPGAPSSGEAGALLLQLERKFQTNLDAGNARAKARYASLYPPSGDQVSSKGPTGPPPADPCGNSFELKAITTAPPLEPGEFVTLEGCGFGHSVPASEVRLVGDFAPGTGFIKLHVIAWVAHKILAQVPMVTGVFDQPAAKIQVFRSDGKFSNWMDVGFKATQQVVLLRPSDASVVCAVSRFQQECTLASSHPLSEAQFFSGATFAAKHARGTMAVDCDEIKNALDSTHYEGADTANVSLKNGWVLAGLAWWWGSEGDGYVLPPVGFAQQVTSATISMKWGTYVSYCGGPRNSTASYRVDLYAVGPKGIPYK